MTELGQLQHYYRSFTDRGIRLIAVSVDPPATNARLRMRLGADYTFLSDPELTLIDKVGIRYRRSSKNDQSLAVPSQYLVDQEQMIRWAFISDTWRKRFPTVRVLAAMSKGFA